MKMTKIPKYCFLTVLVKSTFLVKTAILANFYFAP